MKNLFFVLLSFAFFITSCTKDFVEPVNYSKTINSSVSSRSGTVETTATVSNAEIIIDDYIVALTIEEDITGLVPESYQTLNFTDDSGNIVSKILEVSSFEIIIDDYIIVLATNDEDLVGLQLAVSQILTFNN